MSLIWLSRLAKRLGPSFDGNRLITRSGLPAVTPGGDTTIEFLENLCYPGTAIAASILISGSNIRQFGNPETTVNFDWTVTKGSANVDSVSIAFGGIDIDVKDGTGTQTGNFEAEATQDINATAVITAIDTNDAQSQASATLTWRHANYYAALADDLATVLADLATNGIEDLGFSKFLATNKTFNNDYDCTGGKYIYYCYPASYGNPTSVKADTNDMSGYTVTDVTIEDVYGVSRAYKLFQVNNRQTGADVNINIIS